MFLVIKLTTWADKVNSYAFNDTNDYYMITDKKPLKTNYVVVKVIILYNVTYVMIYGTEQIDNLFNQASF
jgi:hypothetical protein